MAGCSKPVCEEDVLRAVADFKRAGRGSDRHRLFACLSQSRQRTANRRDCQGAECWPEIPLDAYRAISRPRSASMSGHRRPSPTPIRCRLMSRYLKTLDDRLAASGFGGNFYLMLSSGSSALASGARVRSRSVWWNRVRRLGRSPPPITASWLAMQGFDLLRYGRDDGESRA